MTNKNYKELYQELQQENLKLKKELENKIALIDFMYEELDYLSNKIEKVYNEVDTLQYYKKELHDKIKEFSTSLDLQSKKQNNYVIE